MKLPFVSRAFHEARLESYHCDLNRAINTAETFKALWEAERIRADRLVQQLVDMKRDGFSTAAQRQAPAPIPSKIDDAINEKAGSNAALRRHLLRWANGQRSVNVPEDKIVDALRHWRDPDEVEV